jgi:predicted RND superfamily exporter protein/lauroyl/myristoyl acyltransferase
MNRRFWIVAVAAFAALVIAGLSRLHLDSDPLNLLPGDLPAVEGLQLFQRNIADAQELIITIRGPDSVATKSAAQELAKELHAETNLTSLVMWQPIWMERPAEVAELIGYLWLNQPPAEFREMAARLSPANIAATLSAARQQLATSFSPMDVARRGYDPYDLLNLPASVTQGSDVMPGGGQDMFESADGTFRVLFVRAKPDISSYRECIAWVRSIRSVVRAAQTRGTPGPEIAIGFTGSPAFSAEISSGMERDMTSSVAITSIIIAILFWLFHRRWLPMLWLLTLLGVILICTMAFGGLLFGTINFVSLGFAGILLGLSVDYGVVHYQEAMASPNAIIPEIRRAIGPSIFWAAVTTISAFLVLNFGGLPGLAQLGSLVAIGVMLSALVMLFAFLPPLFRDRLQKRLANPNFAAEKPALTPSVPVSRGWVSLALGATAILVLAAIVTLSSGSPQFDQTANALRPKSSSAYAALEELQVHLSGNRDPLWLLVRGHNELQTAQELEAAKTVLERAQTAKTIEGFVLPTPLWPRPDYQAANRAILPSLVAGRELLRTSAIVQKFGSNSFVMTDKILDAWQSALARPGLYWPSNEFSQWVLRKVASIKDGDCLAVGMVYPTGGGVAAATSTSGLASALAERGILLTGWPLLGPSLLKRVQENLWKLVLPMAVLVLIALWLAFNRAAEIMLSVAVLGLSGLCLVAVMRFGGWSWNPLNLMGLPLILGTGVDYSIFMQLALKRHHGSLAGAHHSVGRALLLCGGTAVAGFGSLALSNNLGMSSLGKVCAVGVGLNMLISVALLPVWWRKLAWRQTELPVDDAAPVRASMLYSSFYWRFVLAMTRTFPPWFCLGFANLVTGLYWHVARRRREIIIANLLPVMGGSREAAERAGRNLMRQFSLKLAHLLQFECGQPIDSMMGDWSGWEHFKAAQATKRGILLITVHLGNWEFGAPMLSRHGVKLQVITLAEPGRGFTELRKASRAQWDIDTLVIGEDPFAFVEVIRRLEAGATVALLVDRPPAASRTTVQMFGQPLSASIAAAELARASGCILLPVYVPYTSAGYAAHILPPVEYDRAALRPREARQELTQRILTVFEPPIREHPDQWYHFVPVWAEEPDASGGR